MLTLGRRVCSGMTLGGGDLKLDLGLAWNDSGTLDASERVQCDGSS